MKKRSSERLWTNFQQYMAGRTFGGDYYLTPPPRYETDRLGIGDVDMSSGLGRLPNAWRKILGLSQSEISSYLLRLTPRENSSFQS